jgi:hypothetical protein
MDGQWAVPGQHSLALALAQLWQSLALFFEQKAKRQGPVSKQQPTSNALDPAASSPLQLQRLSPLRPVLPSPPPTTSEIKRARGCGGALPSMFLGTVLPGAHLSCAEGAMSDDLREGRAPPRCPTPTLAPRTGLHSPPPASAQKDQVRAQVAMVLAMEAALAVCIVVASATNCKKDEALHTRTHPHTTPLHPLAPAITAAPSRAWISRLCWHLSGT